MRRALPAVLLLLVGALALALTWSSPPPGPVYTVAHVAAGLSQQPQAWVGRTLTVRGTLVVVSGGGVGSGFCWPVGRCGFVLPTDVPLHIFLLGPTPRTIPAYAGMLAALLAARAPSIATGGLTQGIPYRVWHTAPPVLVVLVRPHCPSATWARLSHMAQQAASNLPDGSWTTLAHLPLVGPFLEQLLMPGTVHGGTPQTYRVRLLPPTPAARRASCALVCDDAVLQGSLS